MDEPRGAQAQGLGAPRSCRHIFAVFTRLALQGFGGVLPMAQRELVERERWLDREQFLQALSLAQVLPGPNIVNLSLMVGDRFFGWRGALAATAGILCAPTTLVLVLAILVAQVREMPAVAGALRGMGIVAATLVVATALKLMPALRRSALGGPLAAVFGLAAFVAIGVLRWPLVGVVLGMGGAAIVCAYLRQRA